MGQFSGRAFADLSGSRLMSSELHQEVDDAFLFLEAELLVKALAQGVVEERVRAHLGISLAPRPVGTGVDERLADSPFSPGAFDVPRLEVGGRAVAPVDHRSLPYVGKPDERLRMCGVDGDESRGVLSREPG